MASRGAVKCNAGLNRDASYGTGGVLGQLADDTLERERRGGTKERGAKAGSLTSPIERRVGSGRLHGVLARPALRPGLHNNSGSVLVGRYGNDGWMEAWHVGKDDKGR